MCTDLPNSNTEAQLYELVKMYQIHRHSKTCRKYKNEKFRFNIGRYFTSKAVIAVPLPDDLPLDIRSKTMHIRKCILEKVQRYIDRKLYPCKNNFFDNVRDDFKELMSIDQILESLEITRFEFEQVLSISEDDSFEMHFKRDPDSCFVNNYFSNGLLAWEANMDIQPVFNQYKAVAYMCAYLSKTKDECSHSMNQALKDPFGGELENYEQMKSLAYAYLRKRDCSVQECIYDILPGQWLRKTFLGVVFAKSNIPYFL